MIKAYPTINCEIATDTNAQAKSEFTNYECFEQFKITERKLKLLLFKCCLF